MCLLIAIAGLDPEFPLFIAGNRDEQRDRPSAPPGLFVGAERRMLSPRDRRAGGTWIAVSDRGMFAGLTNVQGAPPPAGAATRGELPHLALDAEDLDGATAVVEALVGTRRYGGFQLLLSDGRETRVLRQVAGEMVVSKFLEGPVVISNEHPPGQLDLPDLSAALDPDLSARERLARLATCLLDTGARSGHRVLKLGGEYGTVSSSLLAVPAGDLRQLDWLFAAGPPDEAPYRNYGNLARRLFDE